MTHSVADIAKHVEGQVVGDSALPLTGLAPADTARSGDLTFAENEDYLDRALQSAASAILVPKKVSSNKKTLIQVDDARVAFARAMPLFFPEPAVSPGIHPGAIISPSATVHETAHIGPFCVIEDRAVIGPRAILAGGNHIGAECQLGENVHLFPRVVLYARTKVGDRVRIHAGAIIGADGFGYVFHQEHHLKVPQAGNVVIEDDVEIGANVGIDRATFGSTIVGQGTKIDNLVQIGHNVEIGKHCILCGQSAIAGSTKVGNYVTLAGQAGLAGHLKIGDNATVGAQAGVMHPIPAKETWLGSPAQPDRQMKRIFIALQRLPDLLKRVHKLEKRDEPES